MDDTVPTSFPTSSLTFLMTDVEGSSLLWEQFPEAMGEALARHDALIEHSATANGGLVVRDRGEGDSLFAVFRHAPDAVQVAAEIQRQLPIHLSDFPFLIRVRTGIHSGTAEWRDGDYYGPVVNRAARIRGLGHGGQTLLTETTAELVRDSLKDNLFLVEMGIHRLRGLPRPEKVFQLGIPGLANEFPPLQSAPAYIQNLPSTPTAIIGRDREVAELLELLTHHDVRTLTITGPGGMGKTRLAIAVGEKLQEHYHDGVCFVDLAPLSQPEAIVPAIAAALNYQAPDKTADLLPQLLSSLSRRHLLLILDNFEHLQAGAALVSEILHACPRVSVLATSRRRLNLSSEVLFELGGLALPQLPAEGKATTSAAVKLFVDSGRRILPGFELTDDNRAAIVRVCRLVQGVPLGLVLAASWLALLEPHEIAREIENSLEFLAADLADLPERQRSMRAVFEGSWQMLSNIEQTVLVRLGVFRGGFSREAAEQVAGANLRILLALVSKSLLQRQDESGRYTIHELLRQFVTSRSDESLLLDETYLAHCHFFAGLVKAEVTRALYFYPLHMPRQHGADRENLHRAWDYAIEQKLGRELSDLARGIVLFSLNYGASPAPVLDLALEALGESGSAANGRDILSLRLTALAARDGLEDHYQLRDAFLALVPAVEAQGDPELRYWTYERLALVYLDLRDIESMRWATLAREATRDMGDEIYEHVAEVVFHWNCVLFLKQDATTGERLESLLHYFDHPRHAASFVLYAVLAGLGIYHRTAGAHELAIDTFKRALDIARGWQDLLWISLVLGELSQTYQTMGRSREAGMQELDALDWHLAIGQTWQMLGYLWSIPVESPHLFRDRESAVAIVSMVYHHPEATAYYRQKIEESLPGLEQEIGLPAFTTAWEQGKTLDFDNAVGQVRTALAAVGQIPWAQTQE